MTKKIKQKEGFTPEQTKDFVISMAISGVVCILAYIYVLKDLLRDLFGLSKTVTIIITVFTWLAGTGVVSEMIARKKTYEKIAYGRKK